MPPVPPWVNPPLPATTALMVPVMPELTRTIPSAPKSRAPVVEDGLMALLVVNKIAPLVLVSVWPSVMVRSPPAMTNELMAVAEEAVVAVVMRVLFPAVIAFWVNSSVGFKGRRPVVAL